MVIFMIAALNTFIEAVGLGIIGCLFKSLLKTVPTNHELNL